MRLRPPGPASNVGLHQFLEAFEVLDQARSAGILAEDARGLLAHAAPHPPDEFLIRYVKVFEKVSLAVGLSVAGAFLAAGAEVMLRTDVSAPGPASPPWSRVRPVDGNGLKMLADLEMSLPAERYRRRIRTTWAKDVLKALRKARDAGSLARDMDLLVSRAGALLPAEVYERPVKVMERVGVHAVMAAAEVLLVNGAIVWMRSYPAPEIRPRSIWPGPGSPSADRSW